jgi:hypothetical protein
VLHSEKWRSSAAYVALSRHRAEVQIFASHETVRGMDKQADRTGFDRVAEQTTLETAGLTEAQKAHDLDTMAKGFARPENKRAATAYQLDDTSALRIDFDDVAETVTVAPTPAAVERAPASLRGYDRIQAFREAERLQREESQQPAAEASNEPPQPAGSTRQADRVAEFLKAEQGDREARKAALQELTRLFGREVSEQEGKDFTLDRGGGQSL